MQYRIPLVISAAFLLLGCSGGHGYEGNFNLKAAASAPIVVTIGPDYIEAQGSREEVSIFLRESQGEEYLVLQSEDGQEKAWKIIDENTLVRGGGFTESTLTRAD